LSRGAEQNLDEASSAFTQASLIAPDFGPALRGLIEIQVRGNNRGTALSLCDRYLAAQPDDADMLYRKAVLLAQDKNKIDEAIKTIDRAIQVSERSEFLLARSSFHLTLERPADALKDLQRYAELGGNMSPEVDMTMAEIYLSQNEKDLARQYRDSAKQKAAKTPIADAARLERLDKKIEEESQKKP
jgi:tetratricopeptide (TPR) repeat protein